MENNSKRNYDQQGRNSQDQESQNLSARSNGNEDFRNSGSKRPADDSDANSNVFDSGTNAEGYIADSRGAENKDRNAGSGRSDSSDSSDRSSQLYSISGRSDLADNGVRSSDRDNASGRNMETDSDENDTTENTDFEDGTKYNDNDTTGPSDH